MQDGIVALGKAHARSAPFLNSLSMVALETVLVLVWLNTECPHHRDWNVCPFLHSLVCRGYLVSSCSDFFKPPSACQNVGQLSFLLCLPVSSFCSKRHRSAGKGPYALCPVSQQSPKGWPLNSTNVCLVEHKLFPTSEDGI